VYKEGIYLDKGKIINEVDLWKRDFVIRFNKENGMIFKYKNDKYLLEK
jgi:hypothetical protein